MGPYDYTMWGVSTARYACAYDYAAAAVIQQPLESKDFIGRATYKINDEHRVFFEAVGSEVDAKKSFEPYQISPGSTFDASTWYPSTGAAYDEIYNALAAYFGAGQLNYGAPISYRWRCTACGPRQISTNTKSYRLLLGFEGTLGSWDYNAGLSRAYSKSTSTLESGYYYTSKLKAVLGSGLLNPFLAEGEPQTAEAMAALAAASADGVELYGGTSVTTSVVPACPAASASRCPAARCSWPPASICAERNTNSAAMPRPKRQACIWHPSTTAISSGTSAATPRRYSPSCTSRCWTAWT
jgi:iron complex outermembrane receptor protein